MTIIMNEALEIHYGNNDQNNVEGALDDLYGKIGDIGGAVDTYADLALISPIPSAGTIYWVRDDTGSRWLLNFKPRGFYLWTGLIWEIAEKYIKYAQVSSQVESLWQNATTGGVSLYSINTFINYNGELFLNLTGVNTDTAPDSDTTNWREFTIDEIATRGTSLLWGGEISINGDDNSKYDIAAGQGLIINNYTDPQNPTYTLITWAARIKVTVTNIGIQLTTFLGVDASTDFIQQASPVLSAQERDVIPLGVLAHPDLATISKAGAYTNWGRDDGLRTTDLIGYLGARINLSGTTSYSANGANKKLNRSLSVMYGPGIGYGDSKKEPNSKVNLAETQVNLGLLYRTAQLSFSTDAPVTQYDPSGTGLESITDDYWVTHRIYYSPTTNLTFLQYSQYEYDSFKKATDAYDKENFVKDPAITGLPLRAILIVQKDTADLTNTSKVKFIDAGIFGDLTFSKIVNYTRFATMVEVGDTLSYQRQDITLVLDTGVIYADIEKVGGGDLTYIFGEREYTLDCTTGAGVDGKARIALTAGSATVPVKNWISVIKSGDIAILQQSASKPTGEYADCCTCLIPDTTTFNTLNAYSSRRWTNAKQVDGRGFIATIAEAFRIGVPVKYLSGLLANLTIDTGPSPDSVDFTIASGKVKQIYDQSVIASQLSVDGAFLINDFTTPYKRITDLNQILKDATDTNLKNRYYVIVCAIGKNLDTGRDHLLLTTPNGSYSNASNAFIDINGYSVTTFPNDFDTIALLGAFVLHNSADVSFTNEALGFGVNYIDLRGNPPGSSVSGAGTSGVTTFSDDSFEVFDNLDDTKRLKFQVSPITTGTIRTITMADRDLSLSIPTFDQVNVDNLRLDGNTIASLSGDLIFTPTGSLLLAFGGQQSIFGGNVNISAGNLNIGTVPTTNMQKLSIVAADSSIFGPHQAFYTSTDLNYPVFHQVNWTHDNIAQNFDAYWDGSNSKSSDVGSNYQIIKNTDKLIFRYDSGIAAGSNITWNIGMQFDTTGNVVKPNHSSFMARRGAVSNVIGGSATYTVAGFTEIIDKNSNFNPTTGVFTARVSGQYQINVSALLSGMDSTNTYSFITINTSNRAYVVWEGDLYADRSSPGNWGGGGSQAVDMDAGDVAVFNIYCNGNLVVDIITTNTTFSGFLIG